MISLNVDKKELAEIINTLNEIGAEVGQKAFASAMNKASKDIKAALITEMDATVQEPTGRLARALRVRSVSKYRPIFWKNTIGFKTGKSRKDLSGAYYAHMVEYGHRIFTGGRGKRKSTGRIFKGTGFILRAANASANSVASTFKSAVKTKIEQIWRKRAKLSKKSGPAVK